MNAIDIISSVGFPIFCCIALGVYIYKRDGKHEQEIDKLRTAIENNTRVMTELIVYLKGDLK